MLIFNPPKANTFTLITALRVGMRTRRNVRNKMSRAARRRRRIMYTGGQPTTTDSKCTIADLGSGMGLGNQFWVYAAGLAASIRSGLPLCILRASSNPHSNKDYREIFTLGKAIESAQNSPKLIFGNINAKNPHNNTSGKNVPTNKKSSLKMPSHWYQNYKAIIPAIPLIRKDFARTFQDKFKEKSEELNGMIPDKNATLFMHVRKGDYGTSTPPDSYFQKALEIVNGSDKIRTIFVLSDDIAYCKAKFSDETWKTTKDLHYYDDPDEINAMYLMSLCKGGAIISNSTFSSWGAILGADEMPDSIIIHPKAWVTGDVSRIQFPATVGNKWLQL